MIRREAGERNGAGAATRWSGRTGREVATGCVRVIESFHRPGSRVPAHRHDLPFVTLVIRGGYVERNRSRHLHVGQGMVATHGEGDRHSDCFGSLPSHLLSMEWRAPPDRPFVARTFGRERAFRRIGLELLRELGLNDASTPVAIEALAAEIFVLADERVAPRSGDEAWFRMLEERLRSDFRQPLRLDGLAGELGRHRSHIARSFRRRSGCTIGQFLRRLRIEWARERLRQGAPIAQVAIDAGFSDQSHLTRWFRRSVGTTPGALRRESP